jgi:hypothetical protein
MVERIRQEEYLGAGAEPVGNLVSCPDDTPLETAIGDTLFRSVYQVDRNRRLSLGSDHRKHFKTIWGRQSCTWDGDFRFWIWKHQLKTCVLYVASAREKGTAYEVIMKADRLNVMIELVDFFEQLKTDLEPLV